MYMNENLKSCLQQVEYKPDDLLTQKIWENLCTKNKNRALVKLYLFLAAIVISATSFVPVFKMLLSDFAKSGFYEYLSLAFSTNGAITSYWKDFILSLAESLPMMSIIFTLGIVLVFFVSLRYALKQIVQGQLTLISFKI